MSHLEFFDRPFQTIAGTQRRELLSKRAAGNHGEIISFKTCRRQVLKEIISP